jgi:hypothetical protein
MPKRRKLRLFWLREKKMLFIGYQDRKLHLWIAQCHPIISNIDQHQSVRAMARQLGCAKEMVYRREKDFNQHGLCPVYRCSDSGRRATHISQRQMNSRLRTAEKRPTEIGLSFTNWYMNMPQEDLVRRHNFPIVSSERLRRLLHREHVTGNTPQPESNRMIWILQLRKRVLACYAQFPKHEAVVCQDQLGPLELRPIPGIC